MCEMSLHQPKGHVDWLPAPLAVVWFLKGELKGRDRAGQSQYGILSIGCIHGGS